MNGTVAPPSSRSTPAVACASRTPSSWAGFRLTVWPDAGTCVVTTSSAFVDGLLSRQTCRVPPARARAPHALCRPGRALQTRYGVGPHPAAVGLAVARSLRLAGGIAVIVRRYHGR